MSTTDTTLLLKLLRGDDPWAGVRAVLDLRERRVLQVPSGRWDVRVTSGRDITDEGYDQVDITMPGNCGTMLGGFDNLEDEVAVAEHLVAEARPDFVRSQLHGWRELMEAHQPFTSGLRRGLCRGCRGADYWEWCPVLRALVSDAIAYLEAPRAAAQAPGRQEPDVPHVRGQPSKDDVMSYYSTVALHRTRSKEG